MPVVAQTPGNSMIKKRKSAGAESHNTRTLSGQKTSLDFSCTGQFCGVIAHRRACFGCMREMLLLLGALAKDASGQEGSRCAECGASGENRSDREVP